MKKFLKTMLAASIFALTLTASSFASYSNVNELADTINKEPGTFYTLYAGMPVSDYKENWYGIKGWKQGRNWGDDKGGQDVFARSYKLEGTPITEKVLVTWNYPLNVFSFTFVVESNNPKIIEKIYNRLYDNACINYPDFSNSISRKWISAKDSPKPAYIIEKMEPYDKTIMLYMSDNRDAHYELLNPKYKVYYRIFN